MPAGLQSSSMVPNKTIACSEQSDTAPIRRLERCGSNSRCVARPPDDRIFGILIQGYHSSLMCELRRSRGACLDRQTGLSGLPLPKVFSYGGRTHRYWRDPTFGSLARRSSSRVISPSQLADFPAAIRWRPGVVMRSRPAKSLIYPSAMSRALCLAGTNAGGWAGRLLPTKTKEENSSLVSKLESIII